jgi:hypothetical protein
MERILNGVDANRVSTCWQLTSGLTTITTTIKPHMVMIPSHVKRQPNQIDDHLTNMGVSLEGPDIICTSRIDHTLFRDYINKDLISNSPTDGVLVRNTWPSEEMESSTSLQDM